MCDCNTVNAEISETEICLSCECGTPDINDERMKILELLGEYLRQ